MNNNKRWPLDYIVNTELYYKLNAHAEFGLTKDYSAKFIRRENVFKNATFRIILKVRKKKRQPKLKDLINYFSSKNPEGK